MNDKTHRSPSMWRGGIIGCDNVAALQQRLKAGADVNEIEEDGSGYTLLHCAAENGAEANVRFLLSNGADPTIRTAEGLTAAELAECRGFGEIAQVIELHMSGRR